MAVECVDVKVWRSRSGWLRVWTQRAWHRCAAAWADCAWGPGGWLWQPRGVVRAGGGYFGAWLGAGRVNGIERLRGAPAQGMKLTYGYYGGDWSGNQQMSATVARTHVYSTGGSCGVR